MAAEFLSSSTTSDRYKLKLCVHHYSLGQLPSALEMNSTGEIKELNKITCKSQSHSAMHLKQTIGHGTGATYQTLQRCG